MSLLCTTQSQHCLILWPATHDKTAVIIEFVVDKNTMYMALRVTSQINIFVKTLTLAMQCAIHYTVFCHIFAIQAMQCVDILITIAIHIVIYCVFM